jgi:hypothetical protein
MNDDKFYRKSLTDIDPEFNIPVPKDLDPGLDARHHRPPILDWSQLITDGDWAVKEYWVEFTDNALITTEVTPERIQSFLGWLVRLIDPGR